MDALQLVGLGLGSAWLSGINLYATVAALGLLGRFAGLKLPGDLDVLTSWWIIAPAIIFYALEFFADKIPYIDSFWDVIHTFIRIPAGAALAATAFGDYSREAQILALLAGGGVAATSHGAKAGTRAVLNLSPEPFTNWAASVTEDVVVIGGSFVAVFLPLVMMGLVALFLLIFLVLILLFGKSIWRVAVGVIARAKAGWQKLKAGSVN